MDNINLNSAMVAALKPLLDDDTLEAYIGTLERMQDEVVSNAVENHDTARAVQMLYELRQIEHTLQDIIKAKDYGKRNKE